MYKVLYRTGGREAFQWRVVFTLFTTLAEADAKYAEVSRMGYKALLVTLAEWVAIGIPSTYAADEYFPLEVIDAAP